MNQETYTEIKDRIIYVLENAETAEADFRPHEAYLDMIKTFRVYRYDGENDYHITWEDLIKWGLGLEEIAKAARRNTPVLTPPMIYQVAETPSGVQQIEIGDCINAILENMAHIDEVKYPMYMLTNVDSYYGAGSILNEPLLERIGDLWKEDILLLPSSVHEFLMVPFSKKRMELKEWQDTVYTMNSMEDMKGSVLSNSVYQYDWIQKEIVIGYRPDK
ncbi:DUF5688 family protein [Hungatella hathewayi]|uniref:DUF5688 family protein n=1 Tax=Hungatella hathewayi TaxID=154046 RepID=UPI00356B4D66